MNLRFCSTRRIIFEKKQVKLKELLKATLVFRQHLKVIDACKKITLLKKSKRSCFQYLKKKKGFQKYHFHKFISRLITIKVYNIIK